MQKHSVRVSILEYGGETTRNVRPLFPFLVPNVLVAIKWPITLLFIVIIIVVIILVLFAVAKFAFFQIPNE